jgi:hypothetical protein
MTTMADLSLLPCDIRIAAAATAGVPAAASLAANSAATRQGRLTLGGDNIRMPEHEKLEAAPLMLTNTVALQPASSAQSTAC